MHASCPASPPPGSPDACDAALARTRLWLERAVIGLNLCPFARAPTVHGRLRMTVSTARDAETLLAELDTELTRLRETPTAQIETTLLIHPWVLQAFEAYNDFLTLAELAVRLRGMEGEIQIASFHPDYRFEGSDADDIENYTNRSPYPILHLLRETSIDAAVAAMEDTDEIYERNLRTLQRLGQQGWQALWR